MRVLPGSSQRHRCSLPSDQPLTEGVARYPHRAHQPRDCRRRHKQTGADRTAPCSARASPSPWKSSSRPPKRSGRFSAPSRNRIFDWGAGSSSGTCSRCSRGTANRMAIPPCLAHAEARAARSSLGQRLTQVSIRSSGAAPAVVSRSTTSSQLSRSRLVIVPTAPSPMVSFSTATTGSTPQLELVRKTSSADSRSSILRLRRCRS